MISQVLAGNSPIVVTFKEGEICQQWPVASYMNAFKGLSTKNVMYSFFQSSALYAW